MNKNQIIAGVVAVVVVTLGVYLFINRAAGPTQLATTTIATTTEATATSTGPAATTTTVKSVLRSIFQPAFNPRDPWSVLAQYFFYAKAHDIAGVKSLSYQQSAACADQKRQTECFALMDGVYAFKNRLPADNFPIKWEDDKQLVLQTAIIADNTADARGYRQGIIIFTKKPTGDLQVLYFNPNRGWYVTATSTSSLTPEEKLRGLMADGDEDGLEDQVEECINRSSDCVKNNSDKRDTDGDGWWDGVEVYFK